MGMHWTKCPTCAQEEKVRKEAEEVERAKAAKRDAWERKLGQAQIPEKFRDRKLTNYVADTQPKVRALQFAKDYAESFRYGTNKGRSALFVGTPGCNAFLTRCCSAGFCTTHAFSTSYTSTQTPGLISR